MARATKGREFSITLPNVIGVGAALFSKFKEGGVDIIASSCFELGENAHFDLVPADGNAAEHLLREQGFHPEEQEVLLVEMENEIGAFANLLQEISKLRIHVKSAYATTTSTKSVLAILKTADNDKVLAVLYA